MARGEGGRWGRKSAPAVDFQAPERTEQTPDVAVEDYSNVEPASPTYEVEAEVNNTDAVTTENTEGTDVTVTDTTVLEPATEDTVTTSEPTDSGQTQTKAERKRAPRPAINVGAVVVRRSSRTDFTTRATPTESNPVFVAVKQAEVDTPTDILVDNDERKIAGAISILRRAGAKLGVGMHIAPKPYPTEEVDGVEKVVLTFKTSAERQIRGKGAVAADSAE